MTTLTAKPIVKNKFWIVEQAGQKVATIQAIDDGGYAFVYSDRHRQRYPSIRILSQEHDIIFDNANQNNQNVSVQIFEIYGYQTRHKPFNVFWDVKHQFPVYTKSKKSKSFYGAGHYIIKFSHAWVKSFCPKYITLNRYPYQGPFKTQEQAQEQLRIANGPEQSTNSHQTV